MKPAKSLRHWVSGLMLVALLFTQIATAAYACPSRTTGTPDVAMAAMPCAEMMSGEAAIDVEQPGLCFKHCQADADRQPLDPAQPGAVPTAASILVFVLPAIDEAAVSQAWRWSAHEQSRNRAPPEAHSIHHCCYRL